MHVKFPSIEAFRNVQFKVRRAFQGDDGKGNPLHPEVPLPVLTFKGTPKLHGTNAAVVADSNGRLTYQSRDRELRIDDDLFGFMAYMQEREEHIHRMIAQYVAIAFKEFPGRTPDYVAVFGEWAGGAIQKTDIAIRGMDKIWAVVGVRLYYGDPRMMNTPCATRWLDNAEVAEVRHHESRIYHITEFGSHLLEIDFNKANEGMIDFITTNVEKQCPVGAYFGKEGHGEGVVWQCVTPGFTPNDWADKHPESSSYDLTFKSKGEKHEQSKKKEMEVIDPVYVEKVQKFIAYAVTEVRMQQGLDKLTREVNQPLTPKIIGPFIKWVYTDVMKEESDVLEAHEINELDIGKPLAEKAKTWFFQQLSKARQET